MTGLFDDHPDDEMGLTVAIVEMVGPALLTVATAVFILTYLRLPWYATKWGRSIMIMAFAVLGLAFNTALWRLDHLLTPDFSWAYFWPRVVAWWVVAGVYVWKTSVAIRSLRGSGGTDD